jgi:lipid-A-disaccharide synthase
MKKIFILTGEASGDKLASKVIKFKKNKSKYRIFISWWRKFKKIGIKSIYDLKEITYLGFTNVF